MFTALTAPGLTLLFLGVVVSLGAALVWMIWELEQASTPGLLKNNALKSEKARSQHRAPS
jgi:hypothetical protein